MPDWLGYIAGEWRVISAAPLTFVAIAAILFALIYRVCKSIYENRLSDKESTIALLDREISDYKRKLDGASPDEAKAKIDQLEKQIDHLIRDTAPRRLIGSQRDHFINALRLARPTTHVNIAVLYDTSCADCNRYARDIMDAIKVATHWNVGYEAVQRSADLPDYGLAIIVPSPSKPPVEASLLMTVFREIGLKVEFVLGTPDDDNVLELSVTARFAHAT